MVLVFTVLDSFVHFSPLLSGFAHFWRWPQIGRSAPAVAPQPVLVILRGLGEAEDYEDDEDDDDDEGDDEEDDDEEDYEEDDEEDDDDDEWDDDDEEDDDEGDDDEEDDDEEDDDEEDEDVEGSKHDFLQWFMLIQGWRRRKGRWESPLQGF